jgi:hypothetical protein
VIEMRVRTGPPTARLRWLIIGLALGLVAVACSAPDPDDQPGPTPDTVEVEIYLANDQLGDPCGEVFPVTRQVDADHVVTATLHALLAGPTPTEQAQGYGGWFTADTAHMLLHVEVIDHTVHVTFADLREVIPDASSSCGSAGLLAQLDTTLLALDGIDATRYTLADPDAFYTWLQLPTPDRPEPDQPTPTGPDDAFDLDAGWATLADFSFPVQPATGDQPTTGPVSPAGPLPEEGWPAAGFYDVDVTRTANSGSVLYLRIRRWVAIEDLPEFLEDVTGAIQGDPTDEIERRIAVDELAVVLVPIYEGAGDPPTALSGRPGAFATLLADGIDPAYREWIHEPYLAGRSPAAIRQELSERSQDPDFPFGLDHCGGTIGCGPLAYRGPLGTSLLADPGWIAWEVRGSWPPGTNGLYAWDAVALEIRDGEPLLCLWAGQVAV